MEDPSTPSSKTDRREYATSTGRNLLELGQQAMMHDSLAITQSPGRAHTATCPIVTDIPAFIQKMSFHKLNGCMSTYEKQQHTAVIVHAVICGYGGGKRSWCEENKLYDHVTLRAFAFQMQRDNLSSKTNHLH